MTTGKRWKAGAIALAALIVSSALADAAEPFVTAEGRLVGAYQDDVDAAFICLVLERDGNLTYAFIKTNDTSRVLKDIQPLVGRSVSVTGSEKTPEPFNRPLTRRQIIIPSFSYVKIAPGEEAAPFDVPSLDERPPTLSDLSVPSLRKTVGTVMARWQNTVMLKRASGETLYSEFRDGCGLPSVGESIEAIGTPVTDLYRIHLVEAVWRMSAAEPVKPDAPVAVTLDDLFTSKTGGEFIMNSELFGHTLVIKGVLREYVTDQTGERRLLLENDGNTIQVCCSDVPNAANIALGSLVSATGVCVLDSDCWSPSRPFPKNNSIFIVARDPADVVVLKRPPWWTPLKFAIAASVMAGVIVFILFWNAALRILVERKSREVVKAQARKLESELRIAERTRLAADLHDSLSQSLTVIGYQISNARNTLGEKDAATTDCLATATQMIRSCRTDLRRCLWDLRSDVLDLPSFDEAIRRTVAPVAGAASVAVRFQESRAAISDSTAHGVLNAVRELVANAVRHGGATKIRIAGEVRTGALNLSVQDNGCGFDPSTRLGQSAGHFGLDGIAERIERLGGQFEIDSAPGKGAKATIKI